MTTHCHLSVQQTQLALVDRGVTAPAAGRLGRRHGVEVRRVGWEDKQPEFRPIQHAWRAEVAHARLGRSRRLAKSFENTTSSATAWLQVAWIPDIFRTLPKLTVRPTVTAPAPARGLRDRACSGAGAERHAEQTAARGVR